MHDRVVDPIDGVLEKLLLERAERGSSLAEYARSEALAWCVRLVGEKSDTWLADLREALQHVEEVRKKDPVGDGP
jgi:hypothetical protein